MSTKPVATAHPKRYLEIANSLIRNISEGRYVVGSLLPTENELAEVNSASRQTVRAALRLLQDRGYISRKKAVGTRVESINPSSAYLQSVDTIEDLVLVAATEVRAIESVDIVTLDRGTARHLGAPLGSEWIRLTGPRMDVKKNTPFSWTTIYIDVAFNHIVPNIQKHPGILVSSMIEHECGKQIAEIRQTVFGILLNNPVANALGVPPGGAGLRILRHYKDSSQKIFEITETIYPSERVSVSFQLRRGSASS